MTRLNEQPTNLDYLSPTQFKFTITQLPKVEYFVTECNLPGLLLTDTDLQTPFKVIPMMGTEITYSTLNVTFIVDEELQNYIELHNWLAAIGFPQSREQFENHRKNVSVTPKETLGVTDPTFRPTAPTPATALFSDATLTFLSNKNNPVAEARFEDLFPTSVGDLQFTQEATDVDYIKVECTFAYKIYTLHRLIADLT